MNTTVQALLDLYVKLGGSLTDTYEAIANGEQVGNYTTIPDCIEAVKNKVGSGGSSLPAVTAEDNDKFLRVVEGNWDKAEGGSEDFVIHCDLTITGEGVISFINPDKELAEVAEAQADGKTIWIEAETEGSTDKTFVKLPYVMQVEDDMFFFTGLIQLEDTPQYAGVVYSSHGIDVVMDELPVETEVNIINASLGAVEIGDTPVSLNVMTDADTLREYATEDMDHKPVFLAIRFTNATYGNIIWLQLQHFAAIVESSVVGYKFEFVGFDYINKKKYFATINVGVSGDTKTGVILSDKDEYIFDFDVASDGQGGYTATPKSGVTFAAITAALQKTNQVYAKLSDDNFASYAISQITAVTSTSVRAGVLVLASANPVIVAYQRLEMDNTDACNIIVQPLANAT